MPVLAAAEVAAAATAVPPADGAAPSSPWKNGERLHQASVVAALLGAAFAGMLATQGALVPAVLCLVCLIGLNVSLGVLWERLPRVLGRPTLAPALAWTGFASWQVGAVLTSLAWSGLVSPQLGAAGGFLLLSSSFLVIQDFALRFWRAPDKTTLAWRGSLALLTPAAISMAAAALLFAISFSPTAIPSLPHVALSLLVFGSMLPAGLIAIGLSEEEALDGLRTA